MMRSPLPQQPGPLQSSCRLPLKELDDTTEAGLEGQLTQESRSVFIEYNTDIWDLIIGEKDTKEECIKYFFCLNFHQA